MMHKGLRATGFFFSTPTPVARRAGTLTNHLKADLAPDALLLCADATQSDPQLHGDRDGGRPAMVFRLASASDWPMIQTMLQEAALPLHGALEHLDNFIVGTIGGQVVSAAGLEVYGSDALLRSVVVAEQFRGLKYGQVLITNITNLARARGVARLYLLTTTAANYFGILGFEPATREDVPQTVQQSCEFQGACPASATLLSAQVP